MLLSLGSKYGFVSDFRSTVLICKNVLKLGWYIFNNNLGQQDIVQSIEVRIELKIWKFQDIFFNKPCKIIVRNF